MWRQVSQDLSTRGAKSNADGRALAKSFETRAEQISLRLFDGLLMSYHQCEPRKSGFAMESAPPIPCVRFLLDSFRAEPSRTTCFSNQPPTVSESAKTGSERFVVASKAK